MTPFKPFVWIEEITASPSTYIINTLVALPEGYIVSGEGVLSSEGTTECLVEKNLTYTVISSASAPASVQSLSFTFNITFPIPVGYQVAVNTIIRELSGGSYIEKGKIKTICC